MGTSVSDSDRITMIVVFGHGHVPCSWTRKQASDFVRHWFNAREHVSQGGPQKGEAEKWLATGTIAGNGHWEDGQKDYALWAFAVRDVLGVYIYDGETAQDRIARAVEKATKQQTSGDEWKQGGDEQ